jgi:BRCT domain type II-containing protein
VKRRKSTDADKMSKSSESASSTRRENINERVARLLATVPKLEFDNIDMEEDNIDMEEILTHRKDHIVV